MNGCVATTRDVLLWPTRIAGNGGVRRALDRCRTVLTSLRTLLSAPRSVPSGSGPDLDVRGMSPATRLALLERALPSSRAERDRSLRVIPPAFGGFALACVLLIGAALAQQSVQDVSALSRPRTNLRKTRIAYASWNRAPYGRGAPSAEAQPACVDGLGAEGHRSGGPPRAASGPDFALRTGRRLTDPGRAPVDGDEFHRARARRSCTCRRPTSRASSWFTVVSSMVPGGRPSTGS